MKSMKKINWKLDEIDARFKELSAMRWSELKDNYSDKFDYYFQGKLSPHI